MDVSRYLSESSFWTPEHQPQPLGLSLFVPVLFWTVEATNPRLIVQLGAYPFSPYLHLCEAVKRLGLGTRCVAVDGYAPQSISGREEAADVPERMDHDRAFGEFSEFLHVTPENWSGTFPDHSIDLLLLADLDQVEAFERELDAWTRKLSVWGVILLPKTGVESPGVGTRRLFQKLASRYPSFDFTHGDGFGLVATGTHRPVGLRPLLEAHEVPSLRDEIRFTYERLGRSLFDSLTSSLDGATEQDGPGGDRALRRTLFELREENAYLDQRRRKLSEENILLRQDNPFLLHNYNSYRHYHDVLLYRLNQIQGSPVWPLLVMGRRFREACFPESRLHGRCLVLAERFIHVAVTVGPLEAGRKVSRRVARKFKSALERQGVGAARGGEPAYRSLEPSRGPERFEDLPWMYTGSRSLEGARLRPTFKILLIGHTACRTGAPLCLLRVAEELSKLPDLECWTFVRSRGELTDEFARHVPTLDTQKLSDERLPWEDAPRLIASRFREFSRTGIAICNTTAVSEFHEALDAEEVPILSWIHELPTFIDILVGEAALERIICSSCYMVVPADVIRDALTRRYAVDPSTVQTLNNGLAAKTLGLPRAPMRARVRDEFDLPAEAMIVVGCGTIDLRKGADLFVQTARRFLSDPAAAELARRTWFFWFGFPSDEELRDWLVHDVQVAGLSDRVRFVGTRKDMTPYFLGADVFALTSREDPCPFANLEAMESALAVAAFEGSGGAPDVLGEGGIVVPYLDAGAMALAIGRLLADDALREAMGRAGRATVRRDFTWKRYMEGLLEILRSKFDYRPGPSLKVTVIVPSHRHAPYLEERLRSVFEQTVRPHEIIFLDDASHDGSVEIAERLAASAPAPMQIVVNERNSGGTFKQWQKGLEMATGDLIWIAESDDSCHPEFLERLLPEFHDRDVALAYCQSALIGPSGDLLAADFLGHTDDVCPERWRSRYAVDAAEEVETALSQKNTIPNASAVVFRRLTRLDFVEEPAGMRFAGDWLFYALQIRDRKIAYVPDVLNYYRRHEQTVSHQAVRLDTHAEETLHVKARIFEAYNVSADAIAFSLGRSVFEYNMLTERYALTRPTLTANERVAAPSARIRESLADRLGGPADLRILIVIDGAGARAEVAAMVRLANALARDHQVFLCTERPMENDELEDSISDRVVLLEGTLGPTPWSAADPLDRQRMQVLRELIRFHRIEVVHSQCFSADRLVVELNSELNMPWFIHVDGFSDDWRDGMWASAALATVSGVFHRTNEDDRLLGRRRPLADKRWIRIDDGLDGDRAVAVCVEAYRQARGLRLGRYREADAILQIQDRLQGLASRDSA